jgi:TFIIF-interacting CTD phosphatase-like protein
MINNESLTDFELVVDLDSTLIFTSLDMSKLDSLLLKLGKSHPLLNRIYRFDLIDVVDVAGTGSITHMWGVFRPYLKEFFDFSSRYFRKIHVWSAGRFKYVHAMIDYIFEMSDLKPHDVYTWQDCIRTDRNIVKPLEDMKYDLSKTFVLDDRYDTFSKNVENGILIPAYEPELTERGLMKDDISLIQLILWLSLPAVQLLEDIRTVPKSNIFSFTLEEYDAAIKSLNS